jgi:hypothetical protein
VQDSYPVHRVIFPFTTPLWRSENTAPVHLQIEFRASRVSPYVQSWNLRRHPHGAVPGACNYREHRSLVTGRGSLAGIGGFPPRRGLGVPDAVRLAVRVWGFGGKCEFGWLKLHGRLGTGRVRSGVHLARDKYGIPPFVSDDLAQDMIVGVEHWIHHSTVSGSEKTSGASTTGREETPTYR